MTKLVLLTVVILLLIYCVVICIIFTHYPSENSSEFLEFFLDRLHNDQFAAPSLGLLDDPKLNSEQFLAKNTSTFKGADVQNIYSSPLKNSQLAIECKVQNSTFLEDEEVKYWEFENYGKCSTNTNDNITVIGDFLYATCENQNMPRFQLESTWPDQLAGTIPDPIWHEGNNISLGSAQYVLVKCSEEATYSHVFNQFKESVSQKAEALRKGFSNKSRPLTVLLVVLDSVSRTSAFRNLKHLQNYLKTEVVNGQYQKKYSIYDFKYSNAIGSNTRINMVPILYEQSLSYHLNYLPNPDFGAKHQELQKYSIWNHYSSLGFVTYFSIDTVNDYISLSTGKNIQADHTFNNFWKIAKKVYGYSDHKKGQRCLGNENAHFFSMNHTSQFLRIIKDIIGLHIVILRLHMKILGM